MKLVVLLMYVFTYIFKGAMFSSIKVCLTTSVSSYQMTFFCKIDDLNLPVYFYDNNQQEVARCTIPNPFPKCTTVDRDNATVTIKQYPNKNETILVIQETTDHRSNGNWSCHHGKNVHHAKVEINIPNTKGNCSKDKDKETYKDKETCPTCLSTLIPCVLLSLIVGGLVIALVLTKWEKMPCKRTPKRDGPDSTELGILPEVKKLNSEVE